MKIEVTKLFDICSIVLQKNGVPEEQAIIVADSIVYAHRTGKATHGATRLGIYVDKIQRGDMSANTRMDVVKDKGIVTVFDANHGFGQVAAKIAIDKAIDTSEIYGAGIAAVRHSNNFGTAAYFAQMAVDAGKIAVIYSNSAPAIAPWGGSKPLFGTNPMAYGFPTPEGIAPIILDMAVSQAARGKIRLAAKNGEKIPFGWALDPDGKPTDDPSIAILGSMIPIGEHKGSGLALIVDLLAGLLTGAGFAGSVKPLNTKNAYSNNGHLFMVIDPSFFMEQTQYDERVRYLVDQIKSEPKQGQLFLPGEHSFLNASNAFAEVDVSEKVYQEIITL
ncbi:Malate/lactate/ureidoglycolate dehydrogenase, LDH2 family [Cyclonatronum proteinivorum]|uniref:Malate/lactate/ureidoglycolate dehydrogenase, LDH2 family n=1 Tax=Cyclonatronum proteinivorum TaxID=1457365 RepID=A0A345UMI2_9BACT|nr:Ldh family oxidoreductase [Cyclonatronum proteinivorum]AXJ01684.1 Malate/lactate/ureidoglycolate dehydrogenase, LDH2 family [Cyclonatronum proteinivorum]